MDTTAYAALWHCLQLATEPQASSNALLGSAVKARCFARVIAGDPASTAVQGQLVSEMRYLASVVTQCFTAFGELLGMQKRFAELSGGVTRVSELGGTLRAAAAQEATIRNIAAADDITRASRFCAHVATRHLPSRASQANRTAIS